MTQTYEQMVHQGRHPATVEQMAALEDWLKPWQAKVKPAVWSVCVLDLGGNQAIADKAGVSLSTISHISGGVSILTAHKIAQACGLSDDDLFYKVLRG